MDRGDQVVWPVIPLFNVKPHQVGSKAFWSQDLLTALLVAYVNPCRVISWQCYLKVCLLRLVVLDIGAAIRSTINFFNKFKCRLSFADLYAEHFVGRRCGEDAYAQRVSQFRQLLNLQAGTQIGICLFWDLISYLDRAILMALIEAQTPILVKISQIIVLAFATQTRHYQFSRYVIEPSIQLSQTNRDGIKPIRCMRSQFYLHHLLGDFEIEKCRLLADGRIEYLLLENRHDDTKPQLNF